MEFTYLNLEMQTFKLNLKVLPKEKTSQPNKHTNNNNNQLIN